MAPPATPAAPPHAGIPSSCLPPSAARSPPPGTADDLKAQLLGTLLFSEAADLAREWRRPLSQLPVWLREGPHPALQVCLMRRRVACPQLPVASSGQ
jgi:hypothetical protein